MEAFQTFCRIVVLTCCLTYEGILVQLTYAEVNNVIIHDSNATSAVFECNTRLVVRCYGQRDAFVSWQINNTVSISTRSAANCYKGSCTVYNNFTGRYSFDHNSSTGISDLTIAPVTLQDNSMEYKCSDGSPQPLRALVKNVFGNHSVSLLNETYAERKITTFKVNVNCTAENITFKWFSTAINGTDLQFHKATSYFESECIVGICVLHDNSKNRSSWRELVDESSNKRRKKRAAENGRLFGVIISSDSFNVSLPIQGTYRLKEEKVNDVVSYSTGCFSQTGCTIGVAIAISVVIILLVVLLVFVVLRKRKNVDDCPDSPTGLRLINKTETLATFTWTPGPNPEGRNKFRLCYKKMEDKPFKEIKVNGTMETINKLQPGCMYQCYMYAITGNRKSDNSKLIDFTTLGLPDKPTKFEIVKVSENSFRLHWTPGCYRKYDQTFVIECKDTNTGKQRLIEIKEETAASIPFEHLLDSLSAGTEYQLWLYAKNQIGRSARIGPIIQTTLGFPDAPRQLQAVPDTVTETTVTLTWKPGKYRKYRQTFVVSYRLKDQKNLHWADVFLKDELTPTVIYKVDSLKEGKTYEFKIHAKNDIGESKSSNIISIETKGKPESPSELREVASERTSQTITVSFKPGTYDRDTQKFVVNYRRAFKDGRSLTWKHLELVDDGYSSPIIVTILGLRAGKSYEIKINASNHLGSSAMSDTIRVKTEGLLPLPPKEFVCCDTMETEVQLSWKPVIYKQKQSFYLTYTSGRDQWSEVIPFDNNLEKVEYIVPKLSPGTVYEFSVWAFFGNLEDRKLSERCEIQRITTKGLPDDPVDFHLVEGTLTETTAEFCWKPGKYRKYKQIFVISYWTKTDEENKTNVHIDDSLEETISHLVNGLQAGKSYFFCIVAKNDIGDSNISETLHVQTKDEFTVTKS